jgi:hypothetical protein
MGLFISKYELRKLILEEHQFHNKDITLFTSDNNCVILQNIRTKLRIYSFILINAIFHLKLHVFEVRTELLLRIYLFTLQTYTFIKKIASFSFVLLNKNVLDCVYSLVNMN